MYNLTKEERDAVMNWWNGRVLTFLGPDQDGIVPAFVDWKHMDEGGVMTDIATPKGYNVADYFQKVNGVLTFLGPDQDGIVPAFVSTLRP